MSKDKRCFAQFVVAMARLEIEIVPYQEIKSILKQVILSLVENNDADHYGLLKMTLHNLAAINYIEILDYNEKGTN